MKFWKAFGGKRARRMARYERQVAAINGLEPSLRALSDSALQIRAQALHERARAGSSPEKLLVEAYAVGREAARRTLGLRHFDVQLLGAMVLHDGLFAEMKTGEGKTLAATLPAYLNALTGSGVHIVTVNDYLARRDAEWMGPLYRFLGLTVGVILEDMGEPAEETQQRRAAYACDITYGTNHEIAFDYLRDNLATVPEEIVHRGFHYAIVDEVDFLLIDEARTPLIISGPAREDVGLFRRVDRVVRTLLEDAHYVVEAKTRTASLTEAGFDTVQSGLGVGKLVDLDHLELYHAMHQSVLAHGVYKRDIDYIVERGKVFIIDEFTGRISEDKRYANGLHQAIEAKERVKVKSEDHTLAKVTYQTFFGRYEKLAGMTGTAWSERQELMRTYGCDVQVLPTHKPMIRIDYRDDIFATQREKHDAIVDEILTLRDEGRPVLVGTTSVRESELLSRQLRHADIPHHVLNAKNHRSEAGIIAQAGGKGAVTVSTSMAGRGTDIILGGQPVGAKNLDKQQEKCDREREELIVAGGLHVIGTCHHESVRIDDQLRGRAGRQGDPGSSQFIVSLDDEIWKNFGKTEIHEIRAELVRRKHPRGERIESQHVRRTLRMLQKKVEVENQAIRSDVLNYDLVVHVQRESINNWRQTLVTGKGYDPEGLIWEVIVDLHAKSQSRAAMTAALRAHFHHSFDLPSEEPSDLSSEGPADRTGEALRQALALLDRRQRIAGREALSELGRRILLQTIDDLWTEHLGNLERVEEGISLLGYAEIDPVIAWRKQATDMWKETLRLIRSRAVTMWFLVDIQTDLSPS